MFLRGLRRADPGPHDLDDVPVAAHGSDPDPE
jgi:hypothetical protein